MRGVGAGDRVLEGELPLDWLLEEGRRWKRFLTRDDIGETEDGSCREGREGRYEQRKIKRYYK